MEYNYVGCMKMTQMYLPLSILQIFGGLDNFLYVYLYFPYLIENPKIGFSVVITGHEIVQWLCHLSVLWISTDEGGVANFDQQWSRLRYINKSPFPLSGAYGHFIVLKESPHFFFLPNFSHVYNLAICYIDCLLSNWNYHNLFDSKQLPYSKFMLFWLPSAYK